VDIRERARATGPLTDLRGLLDSAFAHGRTLALVAGAVAALFLVLGVMVTPSYSASATLLVLSSEDYANRTTPLAQPANYAAMSREAILSSEVAILTSPGVVQETVRAIGAARLYPRLAAGRPLFGWGIRSEEQRLQAITEAFLRELRVTADKAGGNVVVSFSHSDSAVAALATNALVAQYQQRRVQIYRNAEASIVGATVTEAKSRLDRLSAELAAFNASARISNFDTQLDLLLRRLSEQARLLQNARTESAEVERRVASLREQLRVTPRQVVQYSDSDTDRRVQSARDSLSELRKQESQLRETYTDQSEKVVAVRRQIETMEKDVVTRGTSAAPSGMRRGLSEVHTALELALLKDQSQGVALARRSEELSAQVESIQAEVQRLQASRVDHEGLARQKNLAEQEYLTIAKAFQELRATEDIGAKRGPNVRVVQQAEAPLAPSRIRWLLLLMALVLIPVAAMLAAMLLYRFRATYMSSAQMESDLGLPVLACLAEAGRAREPGDRGGARFLAATS
jgi:uncharacterized protein involved in exopolysaccharide biosynthesis